MDLICDTQAVGKRINPVRTTHTMLVNQKKKRNLESIYVMLQRVGLFQLAKYKDMNPYLITLGKRKYTTRKEI